MIELVESDLSKNLRGAEYDRIIYSGRKQARETNHKSNNAKKPDRESRPDVFLEKKVDKYLFSVNWTFLNQVNRRAY